MTPIREAIDFARAHPWEFAAECVIAFALIWGGAFAVAAAG